LQGMYFPNAIVFGAVSHRSETARLMLTRKRREFANPKSSIHAEIGPIDVEISGNIAIASYPYHFRSTKHSADGNLLELDVPFACGTQIFLEDGGVLRIIHEHLSVAEPGKKAPGSRPPASDSTASSEKKRSPGMSAKAPATDWMLAEFLPVEQVRDGVRRFWQFFSNKSQNELLGMYFSNASVIPAGARRSEPARLAMARRSRELFGQGSSVRADVGLIDVQAVRADASIASYTFHFQVVKLFPNGKRFSIDMPFARTTQLFRRDGDGALRIAHEHMSVPENGVYKELPTEVAAVAKK
jgi:ketosteroid isomerase-like protein